MLDQLSAQRNIKASFIDSQLTPIMAYLVVQHIETDDPDGQDLIVMILKVWKFLLNVPEDLDMLSQYSGVHDKLVSQFEKNNILDLLITLINIIGESQPSLSILINGILYGLFRNQKPEWLFSSSKKKNPVQNFNLSKLGKTNRSFLNGVYHIAKNDGTKAVVSGIQSALNYGLCSSRIEQRRIRGKFYEPDVDFSSSEAKATLRKFASIILSTSFNGI